MTTTTIPQAVKDITISTERVCCIADLHFGIHQNSISWHDTALAWAKWLKKSLKKDNIKDIFILGDVFHYRDEIAVNTLHVVNEIFKILKDFNIVILVGNHDSYYKDKPDVNSLSIFNEWKNITIISSTLETTILNKKCAFVPWGHSITDISKQDVIFGHFDIVSFYMNGYKMCEEGTSTSDILSKTSLVLTGHFHLREEREYDNKKKIVYVGNPFEMDFGDTGTKKGYYLLNFTDLSLSFVENTLSPKHKKLMLSNLLELKTLEELNKDIESNIVKLIIDKKISPDNIDALLKKLSVYKPFSLSVDYSQAISNFAISEDKVVDMSGVDISKAIEEFINLLDIDNKKDIIDYSLDLYKKCK